MGDSPRPRLPNKYQDPLDFVVQIISSATKTVVGTGFVIVPPDGKVVTCRHVFQKAAVPNQKFNGRLEVHVKFDCQRAFTSPERTFRAYLFAELPDYQDDVVLLQLVDPPFLETEKVAEVASAVRSQANPFRSFGYAIAGMHRAIQANGVIEGQVPGSRPDLKLKYDPIQLTAPQADQGISGAPVVDVERNMIVGIVTEAYVVGKSGKNRDLCWAVDGAIINDLLYSKTIQLQPSLDSLPLRFVPAVPQPEPPVPERRYIKLSYDLTRAPMLLPEWVGREELRRQLTYDYLESKSRTIGLIGFGGEGKSCVARQWLDDLQQLEAEKRPDGVFWWDFYVHRSFEEFIEGALTYLTDEQTVKQYKNTSGRVHALISQLHLGRYIFIVDGVDVLQEQDGERYGFIQGRDMREFFKYFTSSEHDSVALVTSRAPLVDLMAYSTYRHFDLTRLFKEDGRALLEKLGVKGTQKELEEIVEKWDGHALTLGLLGSYIREISNGDWKVLGSNDLPIEYATDTSESFRRYNHVQRILRRYDDHLTAAEKAFLKLLSAFRTPVGESAFNSVFLKRADPKAVNFPIAKNGEGAFRKIVRQLCAYGLLKEIAFRAYTTHPLIRSYYENLLSEYTIKEFQGAHRTIQLYYQSIGHPVPVHPTLQDFKPWLEVVHHACQAGAYDEAAKIKWEQIDQDAEHTLGYKLGAHETYLALLLEFFPNRNPLLEPMIKSLRTKGGILLDLANCFTALGYSKQGFELYERSLELFHSESDWHNVSTIYMNLAYTNYSVGNLYDAMFAISEALEYSKKDENDLKRPDLINAYAVFAHQHGKLIEASSAFSEAELLLRLAGSQSLRKYGAHCGHHAEHLRRLREFKRAEELAQFGLQSSLTEHWIDNISNCHRLLGEISNVNKRGNIIHFDEALRFARLSCTRDIIILSLLARGRFYAKHQQDQQAAFPDLDEALQLALESGYRLLEADIRIALAWAYLASGNKERAKIESQRGRQIGEETGYHWAKVDADEVLAEIDKDV